jgi:outer membrane protein
MHRIITLLFITIFFFNGVSQAKEKIAFIDINFIFLNSAAGKDINLNIKQKKKELDDQIKIFKNEINKKKEKLISQKNVLDPTEYSKNIKKLEDEINKTNSIISKKNQNLVLFQKKAEKEFSKKMNLIIEEYSISNSIDIIFKKQDILMAKNELNITNDILNLFNKKINKINIDQ